MFSYLRKPISGICLPSEPNPHLGNLAWADAFVITADSISMLSEACSTGYVSGSCDLWLYMSKFHADTYKPFVFYRKPVYVIGAERCTWKFADFQNTLKKRGLVRAFTGSEDVSSLLLVTWLRNLALLTNWLSCLKCFI